VHISGCTRGYLRPGDFQLEDGDPRIENNNGYSRPIDEWERLFEKTQKANLKSRFDQIFENRDLADRCVDRERCSETTWLVIDNSQSWKSGVSRVFNQNLDFLKKQLFFQKFRFSSKISFFVQNFDFRPKFLFSSKISIVVQNFDFPTKFQFLFKISSFVQNFYFGSNFRLSKISIFVQNFDFRPKFRFSSKIWIFVQNSNFCQKIGLSTKIRIFVKKLDFRPKFSQLE